MIFRNKAKRIIRKHEELNFPQFSDKDQIEMILEKDFSRITSMTGDKFLPLEVLDHYITINETDIFNNISIQSLLSQFDQRNVLKNNGLMISSKSSPYKVLLKDRDYIQMGWTFDEISLKDFFAKLLLSDVPKYSHLNPL